MVEAPNVVLQGTSVVSGLGEALIVRTGRQTELGQVASRLVGRQPETEFERGTRQFGLLILKVMTGQHIMELHGPIFVIAGILILAGIQIMGIGLLGELQVRHFYTASHRAPYAVDRIIRLRSEESLTQ